MEVFQPHKSRRNHSYIILFHPGYGYIHNFVWSDLGSFTFTPMWSNYALKWLSRLHITFPTILLMARFEIFPLGMSKDLAYSPWWWNWLDLLLKYTLNYPGICIEIGRSNDTLILVNVMPSRIDHHTICFV